jgi:hypothetical protein
MKKSALLSASLAATLVALLPPAPAQAIPKTWVASNGNNMNPCTRAAPCASFVVAHNATDPGGEVNCVDAGDFEGISITKSITIDCTGTFASPGTNGVAINTPGVVVTLRGLSINSEGSAQATIGISFIAGSALHIENCRISGYQAGMGTGIRFAPVAGVTARLYVSDSVIHNNGLPASGGGIIIQPSGSGSARVVLDRVQLDSNTHGIFADGTGSTGSIVVQVRDSMSAGNTGNGIAAITNAGASFTAFVVDRTSSIGNAGSGILAQGAGALVHIGDSAVVGNGAGLNTANGGQILSYQDNQATGNAFDGAPTGVLTVK